MLGGGCAGGLRPRLVAAVAAHAGRGGTRVRRGPRCIRRLRACGGWWSRGQPAGAGADPAERRAGRGAFRSPGGRPGGAGGAGHRRPEPDHPPAGLLPFVGIHDGGKRAEIRSQLLALGAGGDQWRDFHYNWGALAGVEAFNHAAASEEEDLAATLTGWAAARPGEALAMLDNLPEALRGQRDQLAESVVSGLADTDRRLATDLVLRLAGEGHGRAGRLMEIVANETIRADGPEAAAAWSESLPQGPLKGAAMNRVADAFVRRDPLAAASWIQPLAGQDYAAGAVARIGGQWAARDPIAAVGWLEALPAGGGQSAGLSNAFGDWEDRDPVAASQYLMNMPRSARRDSSISGFASGYAWQDPEASLAWASDISDPTLRQQTLTRVGQAYIRRDPAAARAWLESSNLPAEARQQILNPRR
jgi:hypothetical protein